MLGVPSSSLLDPEACSMSVSSSFILEHWTVRLLTSPPFSSSLFALPKQPLLMSDHELQPLFTRDLRYIRREYRIRIQVLQPWYLFIGSVHVCKLYNTCWVKCCFIFWREKKSRTCPPYPSANPSVDEVVIWKGTTPLFPVTWLASAEKVWNGPGWATRQSPALRSSFLHFAPMENTGTVRTGMTLPALWHCRSTAHVTVQPEEEQKENLLSTSK